MGKIVSAFLIASLIISCSNKIYYSSSWQNKSVTVDGKIPEWSNPLRFYDQETGISYSISNDHYNLYLVCRISNEFLQTKILRSGLEFGIDTLGKKSFAVSIKYPIGLSQQEPKSGPQAKSESNERADRSSFKLRLLAEAREIQLVGFKPVLVKSISLSSQNNTGISAAIDFDTRGIMNYEAVIPFSTFYKNELTPSDSNTVFSYRIKVNPVSNSNNSENGNRRDGMRGGGSGMRGGGMRGGGMRVGGMGGGGMRGGGMNGNRMSGENGETNYQRNANLSGTTKTTTKLKLAYHSP